MSWTSRENIIIAHAALGGILAMVLWPLAAVMGRYLRSYYPRWVRVHYFISGVISVPVLIVTFALGTAHKSGDDDNWTETHYRLGLVLLILGILQALYGWGIHLERVRLPVTGAGSILRYAHPIVGIIILILGFYQVYEGLEIWGKPSPLPRGTLIAWGVLLAFWVVVYLGGFALIPRQWRERREAERLVHMGRGMGRGEKRGAGAGAGAGGGSWDGDRGGEGRRESVVPLQDEARRAEVA